MDSVKGRYIQLAGSANRGCSRDKLRLAHRFVRAFAREVLSAEGNLVVYVTNDPRTEDEAKLPLIFGWEVLDELERFLDEQASALAVPRAVVITTADAWKNRMTQTHRELLMRLEERGALKMDLVPDELHTGGNVRDKQAHCAHALVTVGGGKGIADLAHKMLARNAPVLPLDLAIGSFQSDGVGSLGLLEKAKAEPERFIPGASELFRQKLLGLSLETEGVDPTRVARRALTVLAAAFSTAREAQPVKVLFLTALPVELEAMRKALESTLSPIQKLPSGTNYWHGQLHSMRHGSPFRFVLACIGTAGNPSAAAMTAELIATFHPYLVVMVGIAAGLRGKCRLGEVILSDRVISYEPAAEVLDQGQSRQQPRPEMRQLAHPLHQDAVAYVCSPDELGKRLTMALKSFGVEFPVGNSDDVAPGLIARLGTIASGEKLLRNPEKLAGLRNTLHGKIEVGEMEATGVATACFQANNTHFLIVRGISDFGDGDKDDRFHLVASTGAVLVAIDFVRQALDLDQKASGEAA